MQLLLLMQRMMIIMLLVFNLPSACSIDLNLLDEFDVVAASNFQKGRLTFNNKRRSNER